VEHEIMLTGIGGQGVQLAARILAQAATLEGREVMSLGTYGGTMRGGSTDATLVVADERIVSPPIVAEAGAALVMHHAFWEPVAAKLRLDAVVVLNSTVFDRRIDNKFLNVFEVPATRLAAELGNTMTASLVLLAAWTALRGFVTLDSLLAAMETCVPSYRQQHIEGNAAALRCGFAALPAGDAPAWPGGQVPA
jgi:Pyruvate/2-oxoacid:ferredoxin oxidoreductase gamma subunit